MIDSASTREFLELARGGDDSAEWHLFSRFISALFGTKDPDPVESLAGDETPEEEASEGQKQSEEKGTPKAGPSAPAPQPGSAISLNPPEPDAA